MTFQLLTEKDVAEVLRCSIAGLRRMRRECRGPRFIKLGRLVRYPLDWLREYVDENANQGHKTTYPRVHSRP